MMAETSDILAENLQPAASGFKRQKEQLEK
jgi:hypothetical protein